MRFKEHKDGGKASADKKVYAYNYYLKKGLPAIQAAGIVGNLAAESAFNITVVGKADSKGSQGIAQWHSERLNGLKKFAGNNWTNLDSQLDYVLHELSTTEKKAKNSLFAAKTPQEASLAFMNDYERPAEWAKRESGSRRINEALKLLGLKPDPNYIYGSEEENNPYRFSEYKKTDYYAPQVSENISSLDNTQETTNLAEDRATEIKNRLEQKKAEKALLQQMILATQVAYVNPADYQSQPTFEEPQEEQMFQRGGTAEVDNKWLQDWYKNRVIPNNDIQGLYLEDKPIYMERLNNIPSVTKVDMIDKNPNVTGQYQGNTGKILITPTAQSSVYTHEANHYLNDFTSTMRTVHDNVVEQNMYKKGDPRLGGNNEYYDYFRNPDEIHSRVQVMRKDAGFKPNEEVTQDKLLNYLKDYKGNDENILQLMNLTDEKGLLEMLNYMAYNSESTKSNIMYAKNGGEKNSLWKNIRANRGSGRKPTKEMLEQERKIKRKEDGGVIEDDRGQWAFPGEITKINSGNITMEGVNYPVYGVDNLGNSQMMYPGQNYQFPGTSVIEYPQIKSRIKTNRFSK